MRSFREYRRVRRDVTRFTGRIWLRCLLSKAGFSGFNQQICVEERKDSFLQIGKVNPNI